MIDVREIDMRSGRKRPLIKQRADQPLTGKGVQMALRLLAAIGREAEGAFGNEKIESDWSRRRSIITGCSGFGPGYKFFFKTRRQPKSLVFYVVFFC